MPRRDPGPDPDRPVRLRLLWLASWLTASLVAWQLLPQPAAWACFVAGGVAAIWRGRIWELLRSWD